MFEGQKLNREKNVLCRVMTGRLCKPVGSRAEGKQQLPAGLPIPLRLYHESSRNLDKRKEPWEVPLLGERRAGHLPGWWTVESASLEGRATKHDGFPVRGLSPRKQGGVPEVSGLECCQSCSELGS